MCVHVCRLQLSVSVAENTPAQPNHQLKNLENFAVYSFAISLADYLSLLCASKEQWLLPKIFVNGWHTN